MGTRLRGFLAGVGIAALLSGCGHGGTSATTDFGGAPGSGGAGFTYTSRAAVVATDVDADGLEDLVAIPRDGVTRPSAYRNLGEGLYREAPPAWLDLPALIAVLEDCVSQDDAQLEAGLAIHAAEAPGPRDPAYAVLHVGDPVRDPSGPPVLEAIEPGRGPVRTLAIVRGHDLGARGAAPTVAFGDRQAQVLFAFPEAILIAVPDGLPLGPAEVRVTRGGLVSAAGTFEVIEGATPVIEAVLPTRVAVGTLAVLRGRDLGTPLDVVEVTFDGAAPVRALGLSHAIAVRVPDGARTGPLTVSVSGRASTPFRVEVGALPVPAVRALVPEAASVGSLVRIEGTDLFSVAERTHVTFGGVEAAIFALGEGSLTAIVPRGAVDGDVVVTLRDRASAGVPFDVVDREAPRLDEVLPTSGIAGDLLTITGTDLVDLSAWTPGRPAPWPLLGDLRVSIGDAAAWFVLPTAEGLQVIVPRDAATGAVVVTVNGRASNELRFTLR